MLRFEGKLVGMRFRPPAPDIVGSLKPGTRLLARRQPENPHDFNAIQILLDLDTFNSSSEEHDLGVFLEEGEKEHQWSERFPAEHMELPILLGYINREVAATISPTLDDESFPLAELPVTFQLDMRGQPVVIVEVPNDAKRSQALAGLPEDDEPAPPKR